MQGKQKRVGFVLSVLLGVLLSVHAGEHESTQNGRVEDFTDFPNEPKERLYYVREYPGTTLFVVTVAVSGILYYYRAQLKKRLKQLLRAVQ